MAFICHYCGKSFTSAEKLRAHKAVHDETQLQCHICDKVFKGKKKFNKNIQNHQTLECEICNQTVKMGSRGNHSRKCGQKYLDICLISLMIITIMQRRHSCPAGRIWKDEVINDFLLIT